MAPIDFRVTADPQRLDLLSFISNYRLVIFAHFLPRTRAAPPALRWQLNDVSIKS